MVGRGLDRAPGYLGPAPADGSGTERIGRDPGVPGNCSSAKARPR